MPVEIHQRQQGPLWCELVAPQPVSLGQTISLDTAAAVSLKSADLVDSYPPQQASVGMPFLMVEVQDRAVLERAQANVAGMEELAAQDVTPDVHLFTRGDEGFDLRARMVRPPSAFQKTPPPAVPTVPSQDCWRYATTMRGPRRKAGR